jgi:hypothetical protein
MEADAELRAFLRRDEHLAPTGFVTRVISACRNNQELRNDGHCHPAPVTTIEQLKNSSWDIWRNVGRKSVEHLHYLFEKNWEDSTSAMAVDGTCKWCGETHRGMCPRKDNRILRNWHGQARRIHNRVSVEAGGNPA